MLGSLGCHGYQTMPQMNVTFEMEGLPELAKRLDGIARGITGPLTRDALQAGGDYVATYAMLEVHRKTGALASDIVAVVHMTAGSYSSDRVSRAAEQYVLIGAAWAPDFYRRVARNRGASGREAEADQTTNPGLYGYFLEVGHRAPGQGLAHNADYQRDSKRARKQGLKVDSNLYGAKTVPPYPWLEPAFETSKDGAFSIMADMIGRGLIGL